MKEETSRPLHKVHWGKYLNRDEHPNAKNFLEEHGDVAFKHIIAVIEKTHELDDIDDVDAIYFDDQDIMCQINRSEYTLILEKAMEWFIESEQYEYCATIRDLMKSVD